MIKIKDLEDNTHYVNPNYIVRIEIYSNNIIIFFTDNFGLKSAMSIGSLLALIEQ